jgi:hypothetical protein
LQKKIPAQKLPERSIALLSKYCRDEAAAAGPQACVACAGGVQISTIKCSKMLNSKTQGSGFEPHLTGIP